MFNTRASTNFPGGNATTTQQTQKRNQKENEKNEMNELSEKERKQYQWMVIEQIHQKDL